MRWLGATSSTYVASRWGAASGASRGDLGRRVLVLHIACRSSPTGRGPRLRPAVIRVRVPGAVLAVRRRGRTAIRVRSTAGCCALNAAIEVRVLGPERWRVGVSGNTPGPQPGDEGFEPPTRYSRKVGRVGKAPVSKTGDGLAPAGVRILYLPPLLTPREHVWPCTGLLIRETEFDSRARYDVQRNSAIRCRPTGRTPGC